MKASFVYSHGCRQGPGEVIGANTGDVTVLGTGGTQIRPQLRRSRHARLSFIRDTYAASAA
jgi:hypothetical protein